MTTLNDAEARARSLTELTSSFLVEAGAGTGKTSLLAGRVVLLLASGVEPDHIAAITFTELAASELGVRVRELAEDLLAGRTPKSLAAVLPEGLSAEQLASLERASQRIDRLTATTIHGFCQDLIRGYAVESDLDPGAQVMEQEAADQVFASVFDEWLQRRLGGAGEPSDPIAVLARDDPRQMAATLRRLAKFRREHRAARPPAPDLGGRPDLVLTDAVQDFRRWANGAPQEKGILDVLAELEGLAAFYDGAFAEPPDFAQLWGLAQPPRLRCMREKSFQLLRPRRLSAWRRLAGDVDGGRLDAESLREFDRVNEAFARLLGQVGGALVSALSSELDEVLAAYGVRKRAAAVLDFDDLLEIACRMLRTHPAVRTALAGRYRRLLVDEFQDTDALQCDIIFRLAAENPAEDWRDIIPRAGALFLVGDPKQAIYRFRGADIRTYEVAKQTFCRAWPDNVLRVTANFRSRSGILDHVNSVFVTPFSASGQPGYVALEATRGNAAGVPSAARLVVPGRADDRRPDVQDAEAQAVAQACASLIASGYPVGHGRQRPIGPGDIALLAPTGNDLWRYERALHQAGLPYASQAGKGLLRRQETQDVLALARVLANTRDTLAYGALLRGTLVGLADETILDIAEQLPPSPAGRARLTVRTPVDQIPDPTLRDLQEALQALRRRIRATTPVQLLSEAIERLNVRSILSMRDPRQGAAANANVDALLERASRYSVRGLRQFVDDLTADWLNDVAQVEGRPDGDGEAIDILSMHSAKGLEWPVVIPINSAVGLRSREELVHRSDDETLHWMMGDVPPPELAAALEDEAESLKRERTRLWYVACTRASDLLVLPQLPNVNAGTWAGVVDLRISDLPLLKMPTAVPSTAAPAAGPINEQDASTFAAEAQRVAEASVPLKWLRPSDHDADRAPTVEVVSIDVYDSEDEAPPVAGGRVRGLVLHKLLEEVLAEGAFETDLALTQRAGELLAQVDLMPGEPEGVHDAGELAATTLRTLALPDVASLRPRLIAEVSVYGMVGHAGEEDPVAGRADALAVTSDGDVDVVVDWKSDVAPSDAQLEHHVDQVRLYMAAAGARRGLLVYMSLGMVRWVEPRFA